MPSIDDPDLGREFIDDPDFGREFIDDPEDDLFEQGVDFPRPIRAHIGDRP